MKQQRGKVLRITVAAMLMLVASVCSTTPSFAFVELEQVNDLETLLASDKIACIVENDPCYGTFTYDASEAQCKYAQWLAANCSCNRKFEYINCPTSKDEAEEAPTFE